MGKIGFLPIFCAPPTLRDRRNEKSILQNVRGGFQVFDYRKIPWPKDDEEGNKE